MKLDFHDILIEPASTSDIYSRKLIDPTYNGFLPLITAPMDTVVSPSNIDVFLDNKINVCLPRGENAPERIIEMVDDYVPSGVVFESYSLYEFIREFLDHKNKKEGHHVLIDVANGHMKDVLDATRMARKLYGDNICLMVGNVASPETYVNLSQAGADYIRIGIGNGGGCLTTEQTGVGYPMASLIYDCYQESLKLKNPAKIVADGGMKSYSDIIKALALGADYVMVGSIFNKALESSGQTYFWKFKVGERIANWLHKHKFKLVKKFRGMSTKEVQKKWGNIELKTSEGVVRFRNVEYTLDQWTNNFEHYLRSAMSYSNALTLEKFIGKANTNIISQAAYKRFNK